MHLTNGLDSILLVLGLLALPLFLTCKSEARRAPAELTFAFGDEYSLTKRGDCVIVAKAERWRDSQISPPEDYNESPRGTLISQEDFAAIWKLIAAVNLEALGDPEKLKFTPTAPGLQIREMLTVVIESDTAVSWVRPSHRLNADSRVQLDAVVAALIEVYARRLSDFVYPDDLSFSVRPGNGAAESIVHHDGMTEVVSAGKTYRPSQTSFQSFWRSFVEAGLLTREWNTFSATSTAMREAELELRVNGALLLKNKYVLPETAAKEIGAMIAALADK
jgi:hypothetical protein